MSLSTSLKIEPNTADEEIDPGIELLVFDELPKDQTEPFIQIEVYCKGKNNLFIESPKYGEEIELEEVDIKLSRKSLDKCKRLCSLFNQIH